MFRKVTLTSINIASHFAIGTFIHNKLREMKPELYQQFTTDTHYREEVVKQWAKIIGVSIGVALLSSLVAGVITNAADGVFFPNEHGPY